MPIHMMISTEIMHVLLELHLLSNSAEFRWKKTEKLKFDILLIL